MINQVQVSGFKPKSNARFMKAIIVQYYEVRVSYKFLIINHLKVDYYC